MGVYFGIMGVDPERWERARAGRPALTADDEAWLEEHQVPPQLMPWARQAWEAGDFRIVQVVDGFATLEITFMEPKGDPPSVNCRTRVNGRFHPGDGLALSRIQQQQWCFIYEFVEFLNRYVPGYEEAYLYVVSPYFQARGGKSIESVRALTLEDVAAGARFDDVIYTYYDDKRYVEGGVDVPYRMLIPRGVDGLIASGAQRHEAGTPVPPALQRPADGAGGRHGGRPWPPARASPPATWTSASCRRRCWRPGTTSRRPSGSGSSA